MRRARRRTGASDGRGALLDRAGARISGGKGDYRTDVTGQEMVYSVASGPQLLKGEVLISAEILNGSSEFLLGEQTPQRLLINPCVSPLASGATHTQGVTQLSLLRDG